MEITMPGAICPSGSKHCGAPPLLKEPMNQINSHSGPNKWRCFCKLAYVMTGGILTRHKKRHADVSHSWVGQEHKPRHDPYCGSTVLWLCQCCGVTTKLQCHGDINQNISWIINPIILFKSNILFYYKHM